MSTSSQNHDHYTLAEAVQLLASSPLPDARFLQRSASIPTASPVIPPEIPRKPEPKKPSVSFLRSADAIPQHRLHHLEVTRRRLQLTDPDRHDLDVTADRAFAAMAPGYPQDTAVTA